MKRVLARAIAVAAFASVGAMRAEASAQPAPTEAPTVAFLTTTMDRALHFGMSHTEVTDAYNKSNGLFDREYAAQLARLQPGFDQDALEADRENRKADFARSYTLFMTSPTGYDVTPLRTEYTYNNGEAIQKLFKDGKNRYFFYIKDRFWKLYDEVPLREGGSLGSTFQEALLKVSGLLGGVSGRVRTAPGVSHPEADWQDATMYLRLVDRSREHLVGLVLEDKNTLRNLTALRANQAVDPFAIDPAIAAITAHGVSDPNAEHAQPDAGTPKMGRRRP